MKRLLLFVFSLVSVSGFSQTTYYFQSGNINDVGSWKTESGGGGTSPANFTNSSDIWDLNDKTSATLSAAWELHGTLRGSSTDTLSITSGASDIKLRGDVQNGDKINISTTQIEYFYTGGTVDIIPGSFTIDCILEPSVSGIARGDISVTFDLEIANGATLDMDTYTITAATSNATTGITTGKLKTGNTSATPISSGGTWKFVVEYDGSSAQTIPPGTFEAGLITSGGGAKTASGDLTVHSSLELNTNLDMSTHQLNDGSSPFTVSGSSTLTTGSTDNPPIPSGKTWPRVAFNASSGGPQYVPSGTYDVIGDISNTASVTHEALGDITITSQWIDMGTSIDMKTHRLLTDGDGFTSLNIGTFTIYTQNTSANPIPDGHAWGSGATVSFNSAVADQTIPTGTYYNLQVESSSSGTPRHKTTGGAITVNNGLVILDSDSYLVLNHALTDGGTFGTAGTGTYGTLEIGSSSPSGAIPSGKTWYCGVFIDKASYSIPSMTLVDNDLSIGQNSSLGGNITFSGSGNLEMGNGSAVTLNCGSNTIDFGSGGAIVDATGGAGSIVRTSADNPFSGTVLFASTATASFYGGASQVIPAGTYRGGITTEASTGLKTLGGAINLDGTSTINSGSVLDCSTYAITEDDPGATAFVIAGSGSIRTSNTSTAPVPADKDWSSLTEFSYQSSSTSIVGGTYSDLDLNGNPRTLTTQGNITCSSIQKGSSSNLELDIAKNTYINTTDINNFSNDLTIKLKADSDGYGQLKMTNAPTNTGSSLDFVKEQYLNLSSPHYVQMSIPLTGCSLDDLKDGSSIMLGSGASASQVTTWYWNPSNSSWEAPDITFSMTDGLAARGQAIYAGTTGNGTFLRSGSGIINATGQPITSTINYGLSYHDGQTSNNGQGGSVTFVGGSGVSATQGWNMPANPYLGNYDWQDQTIPGNISSSIYQWDGTQYFSYNTGSQTGDNDARYISPGKAFWIQATGSPGGALVLDPANVELTADSDFWKTSTAKDGVTLTFSEMNGDLADNTYINFNASATPTFDPQYDAHKLTNSTAVPSNWVVLGNNWYSICTTPISTTDFPISFKDADANQMITVTLNDADLTSFNKAVLEDLKTGMFTELTNGGSYTFANDVNYSDDRFILHFTESTISIEENNEAATQFEAFVANQMLTIINHSDSNAPLKGQLVDLSGRVIHSFVEDSREFIEIPLPKLTPGVYLLTITQDGKSLGAQKLIAH